MSCLDEEIIAAFAEARLPPDDIVALEAHVSGCAGCRALVSLALAATPDTAAIAGGDVARPPKPRPALQAEQAALSRGTPIGRYTLLALVGRGGMGEVYAAYDPELDRKVALKLLHRRAARRRTGASASRLLREAKAIARLSHPNVVVVHDAGTFGDRVFIAMEFVDGQHARGLAGRAAAHAGARSSTCSSPPAAGWRPRTPPGSSTATSSRRT